MSESTNKDGLQARVLPEVAQSMELGATASPSGTEVLERSWRAAGLRSMLEAKVAVGED